MKLEEIYKKAQSVEGIGGMTVNERLYVSGLMDLFDSSLKENKGLARVILQALKVDEKSIIDIVGIKKHSNSTGTPWDFDNMNFNVNSPSGSNRIEYEDLYEIAMGGPLRGTAYWINSRNDKIKVSTSCGVPPVWNVRGNKFAIPVWTKKLFKGTIQKIGLVDIEKKEFTLFKKTFDVIAFNGFEGNEIFGTDSPIHNPKTFIFDISKERIDYKTQIKTIGNKS